MSDKTIVVTRPKGDEKSLVDLFHSHGYRVIHEPLTHILLNHTQRQALEHALLSEPDAVILTSRHAAQALALLTGMRDAFLLCVGDATARVALSLGFTRISVAGGNVQSLIDHIMGAYDEESRFLYLSGEHVRVDLEQVLTDAGMQVEQLVIYEAVAATQLSDTLVEQLRRQQVDAVTLLSQRTAHIFMELLEKADTLDSISHLDGFCLSKAISEPLLTEPWRGIHVANEATLASLLQSVDNVFRR